MKNKFFKTLAVFVPLVFLASCLEEVEAPADHQATAQDVQTALFSAWGPFDPLSMKVNSHLFQETVQTLETNPNPFFVLQEGITIIKQETNPEDAAEWIYRFAHQTRVFKNGDKGPESTREEVRFVAKDTAELQTVPSKKYDTLESFANDYQMSLGFENFMGLAYACLMNTDKEDYYVKKLGYDSYKINCVNLKTEDLVLPAPDLMKEQSNCGGLANCQLNVKKVSFDWIISVVKGANTETQRVNYSVQLAPELPFLARVPEYCFRQLFPVQNQKVLVKTCSTLRNFIKGEP